MQFIKCIGKSIIIAGMIGILFYVVGVEVNNSSIRIVVQEIRLICLASALIIFGIGFLNLFK